MVLMLPFVVAMFLLVARTWQAAAQAGSNSEPAKAAMPVRA
jgi:hypothetical protein